MHKSAKEIDRIRISVVSAGKRQRSFIKRGLKNKNPKAAEKYLSQDCVDESGAIDADDAYCLYKYIRDHGITCIAEVGTWFGTSAIIMAHGMHDSGWGGAVHTCDTHKLYVGSKFLPDDTSVSYYNKPSNVMFEKMIKNRVHIDFAFIDGRLISGDGKLLRKLFVRHRMAIGVHDRTTKGLQNIKQLRTELKDTRWNLYNVTPTMAMMVEQ
jgi:hypothetical protein